MADLERRFCRRCDRSTIHRHVRVNAFGDRDEGTVSRLFFGVISAGMSEIVSDHRYECQDCGGFNG